ncbi:hypothetical protein [Sphingosinicella rhizophila]|uniref:Uncharacterized protein n=1 Tax=Sphingosinicella rhizophila TaxID=3050082 RepID=A0ABU3Q2C1_9SPHN|nr:hypothetical protein [Sphingosinicella sp. GR2756]MDT9597571.1 hypothetical protein [Sphingosinicella sp. GR2756]
MKSFRMMMGATAAMALCGGLFGLAQAQQAPGGTANYWVSADTSSGMAGMASAASAGGVLAALSGRNQESYVHNLQLQLGSPRKPAGEANAEHLPPAGLRAGPSLPLMTPRVERGTHEGPWPANMEKPKGRMLIYWGCGDRARPNQPVVIDFAALTSGKVPPAFANANIRTMSPPSSSTSTTYGEWPNQKSETRVPANGSLVGEHVVRGNYTPEIRFTIAPGQDYLDPVRLTSNSAAASGAVPVTWSPVTGARAWFASTMGSGQNGDFVMWSSSEAQMAAMMMDYLPEAEIARLVQQKVLLPATADRCTVPAEVAAAAPQSMLSVIAFGNISDFSHPVRPAKAPASWRPDWTVKVRTKSTYMGMLGMDMEAMMRGDDRRSESNSPEEAQPRRKKASPLRRGLGKLLGED